MSTFVTPRRLFSALLMLGLSVGAGLALSSDGIRATSPGVDGLRDRVLRDGWVHVRVQLAVVPTPSVADSGLSAAESVSADVIEDLLFRLPAGSYTDVAPGPTGSTLIMRVDQAGLDGLLAATEVAGVALAERGEPLWSSTGVASDPDYAPDRILVKFRSELSEAQADGLLARAYDVPAWLEPEQRLFSTWVVSVDGAVADIPEIVDAVRRMPNVAYAEPDYRVSIAARPNDPSFGSLWGLENRGQTGGTTGADIRAVAAWDLTTGDPNTVVAVIDTGVDYTHPDLGGNMWVNAAERNGRPGVDDDGNGYIDDIHGINAITRSGNPMDDHGHGTHCAGTISAVGNNGVGVTGVSWRTKLMALKFLSASGRGYMSDAVRALQYATMMKTRYGVNVRVTSNSWGGGGYSQSLRDAIQASNNAGMLFVAAAGNDSADNDSDPHYPSSYDNAGLIAVASSDHNDALSWFSNVGRTSVDLAAPGSAILSTLPFNRYGTYSGTSMATPHVAGAAALLWSYSPSLTPTAVKSRLMQTVDAKPAFTNGTVSGGRLSVYAALLGSSAVPAAPMNLVARAVSRNRVDLTWRDASLNEQGFLIERKIGAGSWVLIAQLRANVTSFANSLGVTRNNTYRYRVRAFNAGGTSAWATSAAVRTPR